MPVKFVHLTDLHVSHPDLRDQKLSSDTVANLEKMVERLRQMRPQPDFIVASGDLTNHGDQDSYELVRDILRGAGLPVVYALGNHDKRGAFRMAFPDIADNKVAPDAPFYHQIIHNGLRIITLDSSLPGRVSGGICDEQFQFLACALEDSPALPKLLVIHHPPLIDDTSLPWESLNAGDTNRLAEVLKPHDIAGILCGHIHINRISHWHGIPVIVNGGLHATVDPLRETGMQIEEGTGFGYCTLRPSGLSVTFVPLTPDRHILGELSDDLVRSFQ